jgi:APA family basic amino acid/polyamine antiporter
MTMLGALSYAELAAMMPYAGGQYIFLRDAFTPVWGFLYGWAVFLVIQTGSIAAVGVAFAKYLGVLAPQLGTSNVIFSTELRLPQWLESAKLLEKSSSGATLFQISAGQCVAVGVIMFLTLLNCRGVSAGKWVQNLFTLAKTAALVGLIVLGLGIAANAEAIQQNLTHAWYGRPETQTFRETLELFPATTRDSPLLHVLVVFMVVGAALTGSLFSADAWNNVTFTAGEVKDPKRNLARSMALGTGLVITLYLLANLAYLAVLPMDGKPTGNTPFARGIAHAQDDRVATALVEASSPALAQKLGIDLEKQKGSAPSIGAPLMAIAIMVSTFGCINGMVLMGARLYYAMARDGLFFQSVGGLNRRGVPAAGLILQGIWASLLTFSGTYNRLLDFVMIAVVFFYVLTVIGLFVLRYRRPDIERPYRAFGYPVLPALYIVLCALFTLNLLIVRPEYTRPCAIIVLTGIPVYWFWRLRNKPAPA